MCACVCAVCVRSPQGYYLPHAFPCERASYAPVPGYTHEDVVVSQLTDYPVAGWVVQARPGRSPRSAESAMAAVLMQICGELQAVDQPFNVLIVEQGARAFVWPQVRSIVCCTRFVAVLHACLHAQCQPAFTQRNVKPAVECVRRQHV